MLSDDLHLALRRLAHRAGGWPRWALVAVFVLAAVASAVSARQRAEARAATATVLVGGADLPAGHRLGTGDLTAVRWPTSLVPHGTLRSVPDAVGRVLAGPLARGEPLTTVRLRGPGVTAGLSGTQVAVTVALASAAGAAYIRPGDRVDVILPADPDTSGQTAETSGVPSAPTPSAGTSSGASADDPSGTASRPTGGADGGQPATSATSATSGASGPSASVIVTDVAVLAVDHSDMSADLLVALSPTQALAVASAIGPFMAILRPAR